MEDKRPNNVNKDALIALTGRKFQEFGEFFARNGDKDQNIYFLL